MRTEAVFVFPGGRLRHLVVAATAGNVVTDLSPTAEYRWLVIRGRILLTTDGTVVTRQIRITPRSATAPTGPAIGGADCLATATSALCLSEVGLRATAVFPVDTAVAEIAPICLEGTDVLRININAGVVGDSYSGSITVLEMPVAT